MRKKFSIFNFPRPRPARRGGQFSILILILLLAAFLRFWHLGKVPPSPDWDEAALGYNAYSMMKTGRDEYGQFLPLILRSFDDYKPAIYAYFLIPSIKIFGLNTFAVRFPAALLGTIAVLLVYFLVRELFPGNYPTIRGGHSPVPHWVRGTAPTSEEGLSLITAFLLAISPWHLQFSRIAFESGVGLFFNILIALLFLKGLRKPWFLVLAAFFAGLNIYVYQAEKVFTPLLGMAMIWIWRKRLLRLPRKYIIGAAATGLVLTLPFINMALTTPEVFLRARGTSFAADQTPFLARTVEKLSRDYENKDYLGLLLDNRRITYALSFINGYLSHFDFNWLFLSGDEARHHAPGMGLLYLWELPFLLLGIYALVFGKIPSKVKYFIFSWFLLAPVPASFTSGVPHGVRTLRFLPMMQVFVALGVVKFWQMIKSKTMTFKLLVVTLNFALLTFNLIYYLNQYFVQQNYFNSQAWQYGYQEAIEEIEKIEERYEKIIVSNQPHLDQSYIFFLFYLKYDPALYQKLGGTVSGGFAETHRNFLKYVFRPIKWEEEEKSSGILYVGRPEDFPAEVEAMRTINFLDNQPAIKLVEGR